eukprot:m.175557 g.175557  ORF g.175557 m.175557 type:complete len:616 (+) comp10422_c0_seq9:1308-3155(+)
MARCSAFHTRSMLWKVWGCQLFFKFRSPPPMAAALLGARRLCARRRSVVGQCPPLPAQRSHNTRHPPQSQLWPETRSKDPTCAPGRPGGQPEQRVQGGLTADRTRTRAVVTFAEAHEGAEGGVACGLQWPVRGRKGAGRACGMRWGQREGPVGGARHIVCGTSTHPSPHTARTPQSPLPQMSDESAKKVRIDHPPSKVLFLHDLPPEIAQPELERALEPIARAEKILLFPAKQQALVEFADIQTAHNIVQCGLIVRGTPVRAQFSSHNELQLVEKAETPVSPVLLVKILKQTYPISLDTLHFCFGRFGRVHRIIMFRKATMLQALIELATKEEANHCRGMLDGQSLYPDSCILQVTFSKLTNLQVKFNDEKSRDYTTDAPGAAVASNSSRMQMAPTHMSHQLPPQMAPNPYGYMMSQMPESPVVLVSNLPAGVTCEELFLLFGVYGDVMRVKVLFKKQSQALIQYREPAHAQLAINYLHGVDFGDSTLRIFHSKFPEIALPKGDVDGAEDLTKDYSTSPLHRFKPGSKNLQHIYPPSPTLHLSNLPEDVTESDINALFNQVGTVAGFRFFQSDKRMALVKMETISQALRVLSKFHYHELAPGKHMRISFSKHPSL